MRVQSVDVGVCQIESVRVKSVSVGLGVRACSRGRKEVTAHFLEHSVVGDIESVEVVAGCVGASRRSIVPRGSGPGVAGSGARIDVVGIIGVLLEEVGGLGQHSDQSSGATIACNCWRRDVLVVAVRLERSVCYNQS